MSKFFKALKQAEEDRAREAAQLSPSPAFAKESTMRRTATRVEAAVAVPGDEVLLAAPEADPTVVAQPTAKQSTDESRSPGPVEGHLVSLLAPTSIEAEQYRTLRTMLEVKRREEGPLILAVSSPGVGDGKTTTAINLAGVLAEGEEPRVLLLDADLRNPSVASKLGLMRFRGGLAAALRDRSANLDDLITRRPPYRIDLILAGESTTAPYELLKSNTFAELLDGMRQVYDFVIVDTPPIVSLPDCRLLGGLVDGFIIVVAADRTPRKLVEEALNSLNPDKVLGFVFNNDQGLMARYASYYGYNMAYADYPEKRKALE
jgi:capsular exopolysaccharide synthesis family protein